MEPETPSEYHAFLRSSCAFAGWILFGASMITFLVASVMDTVKSHFGRQELTPWDEKFLDVMTWFSIGSAIVALVVGWISRQNQVTLFTLAWVGFLAVVLLVVFLD